MSPSQNKAAMQEHIAQWQASRLTQAEYCKAHAIKPHIFSYYKKKFSSASSSGQQTSQLVPVKFVAEDRSDGPRLSFHPSVIKVTHTNGFSLEIQADTKLSVLKPLLELVRSIS